MGDTQRNTLPFAKELDKRGAQPFVVNRNITKRKVPNACFKVLGKCFLSRIKAGKNFVSFAVFPEIFYLTIGKNLFKKILSVKNSFFYTVNLHYIGAAIYHTKSTPF